MKTLKKMEKTGLALVCGRPPKMHHGMTRFRTGEPDYSDLSCPEYDWGRTVYAGAKGPLPDDAPGRWGGVPWPAPGLALASAMACRLANWPWGSPTPLIGLPLIGTPRGKVPSGPLCVPRGPVLAGLRPARPSSHGDAAALRGPGGRVSPLQRQQAHGGQQCCPPLDATQTAHHARSPPTPRSGGSRGPQALPRPQWRRHRGRPQ